MDQLLLVTSDTIQLYFTDTAALALVATIGYIIGRLSAKQSAEPPDPRLNHELARATQIARELQQIAGRIRQDVASHQSNISQFRARVSAMQDGLNDDSWLELSSEAESLLSPTMKLTTDLSLAYDQLRKQTVQLMNFAGSRTDPQTGLNNRRAMEEQLEVLFSLHTQNENRFALALLSIDCDPATPAGEQALCNFAELLEKSARDTDVVARYSSDEFVALMPHTSLPGATIFCERLLRRAAYQGDMVVSIGLVEAQGEDDAEKILSRADSSLYSARANGYSSLCLHNGKSIRRHEIDFTQPPDPSESTIQIPALPGAE
jgi:diguanylate cyclase (GGDEF)-like protein